MGGENGIPKIMYMQTYMYCYEYLIYVKICISFMEHLQNENRNIAIFVSVPLIGWLCFLNKPKTF